MVWPTLQASWAAEAVELYEGTTVAYLGDPHFEQTANQDLESALLKKGFTLSQQIHIGSWPHLFDDWLEIWKR